MAQVNIHYASMTVEHIDQKKAMTVGGLLLARYITAYTTNFVPRAFPSKNGWGGKRPWHRLVTCLLVHPKILGVIN